MNTKIILEFSEHWLKAAVVNQHGRAHAEISNLFLEPLEPTGLNISPALNNIFRQAGKKKGLEVLLVVNRNKLTLRKIDLPSRDNAEIEQMLGLHVIRQVPYPEKDISWSYQNLGFDGISNSHILLAIAHRDILRTICNGFVALNILPENILLSSQGVVHYARHSLKDRSLLQETSIILDVDYSSSDLILVNKEHLQQSIVIAQGFEQLESEESRRKFLAELKQALAVFHDELSQNKDPAFFLTGAAAGLSGIDKFFENELNLKTQLIPDRLADDFKLSSKNVSLSAVSGFSHQQDKEDISFTLPEVRIKKEIKLKIKQLMIMGTCIIYIFIMMGLLALLTLNRRQVYRDRIRQAVGRVQSRNQGLVDIAQKVKLARQYTDNKATALDYIYELTRVLPENIVITNFSWEKKNGLAIRGYAYQMPDIFSFMGALDKSPILKGLKTKSTRRHRVKDKDITDFEIGAK